MRCRRASAGEAAHGRSGLVEKSGSEGARLGQGRPLGQPGVGGDGGVMGGADACPTGLSGLLFGVR